MDGQPALEREFSNVGSMCLQDGMQKVTPGTRPGRDPLPNPAVLEIKSGAWRRRWRARAGLCVETPARHGRARRSPRHLMSITLIRHAVLS